MKCEDCKYYVASIRVCHLTKKAVEPAHDVCEEFEEKEKKDEMERNHL